MNYKKANEEGAVGKRRLLLDGEERRDFSANFSVVGRFFERFERRFHMFFIKSCLKRCRKGGFLKN
jgi:hypothetical protein